MDHVDFVLDHLDKGHALVHGQAVLLHLLAADAVVDEKVRADGLAHRLDNHNGEPGPIFQTAAEAVGTVVIGRGQELAQQPAMGAV